MYLNTHMSWPHHARNSSASTNRRTSSISAYECIRPEEFHSEDDEEFAPD